METRLLSIQIGRVTQYGEPGAAEVHDRPWTTAFFKTPVSGPVLVGPLGIEGDEQADRVNHGGEDKAILGYAVSNYDLWRQELQRDMPPGAFGENLTLTGPTEQELCLGDVWTNGSTRLQISQPRQPCWKLARRWRMKELPALVIENSRSGWYYRVLTSGVLNVDDVFTLESRPHPSWTVARLSDSLYHRKHDQALAREIVALEALSTSWREEFAARL